MSAGDLQVCSIVGGHRDRKSTRLNSSHSQISYAVFCLKKKKNNQRVLCPEISLLRPFSILLAVHPHRAPHAHPPNARARRSRSGSVTATPSVLLATCSL